MLSADFVSRIMSLRRQLESGVGGNRMTVVFFILFSWFLVQAKTRRQRLALAVVGTAAAALIAPRRVEAQSSLVAVIQAVLNAINGVIQTALNSINTVRMAMADLYQTVIWPVNLINQAKAQVTQMTNQYRGLMRSIFNINLASATLPATQQLETVIRNQQTSDLSVL